MTRSGESGYTGLLCASGGIQNECTMVTSLIRPDVILFGAIADTHLDDVKQSEIFRHKLRFNPEWLWDSNYPERKRQGERARLGEGCSAASTHRKPLQVSPRER